MKPSLDWLLALVPAALLAEHFGAPAPFVFFAAALAVVPMARLIVRATEQLATYTGDAVGGLLNATFGNAPELIIVLVALRAGLLDMARASIAGAMLANLLFVTGLSFFAGGLRHHTQTYQASAARVYCSMMAIATLTLVGASAFSRFFAPEQGPLLDAPMNIGLSITLLALYVLYLVFMLKTHPGEFRAHGAGEHAHEGPRWSRGRAIAALIVASAGAAWMSEVLVGAAEGTAQALGMPPAFVGLVFLALVGGAAESSSAVAMAMRDKMDLSLGIALGACIQVALFVAPVLALASYFIAPRPLELSFTRGEVGTLLMAVLVAAMVAGDGRSNWFKGVQLIAMYLIIALMFFCLPGGG